MTVDISKIPKLSDVTGDDSDDLLSFPAMECWGRLLKFISEDGPWHFCWPLLIWRLHQLPPTQSRLVETVCSLFGIIFSVKMWEHQILFQELFTLSVIVANYQRAVEINVWILNKWPLRTEVLSDSCQPDVQILFVRLGWFLTRIFSNAPGRRTNILS